MLELDAAHFIGVVTEVRRLCTILEQNLGGDADNLTASLCQQISTTIKGLCLNLSTVGAQSAWVAADRLDKRLNDPEVEINFADLRASLRDVESRFADHLAYIKLFVVRGEQLPLLGSAEQLLGEGAAARFQSVWFDCEEAAKCLCVLRPTAAVFHAMRMLEVGIRTFARKLGIPDPVKPAERNWGSILRIIKAKIDTDYPANSRKSGSEGAFLESLYTTLDAVKNPWRNDVMHVEGVYQETEASFILSCTIRFIQKMATGFGEDSVTVEPDLI